ncbi:MAG: hypothetical protein AB1499_04040, partial [Nitrospirota bacterium]
TPSVIVKKLYNIKASRKAAGVLKKIDTKCVSGIGELLKLMDTLRDCWLAGLLENLPDISHDVLLIVIDQRNRSILNARFLASVAGSNDEPISALSMLQWMHAQGIRIHYPFADVSHLRNVYEQMIKRNDGHSAEEPPGTVPLFCPREAPGPSHEQEVVRDMISDDPLAVPYRMENASDIKLAGEHDVLGLGTQIYSKLLTLSGDIPVIEKPAVLKDAKPVSRDFYILKEKKITQHIESYKQSKALDRIGNSELISEQFPDIDILSDPGFLDDYAMPSNEGDFSKRLRGQAYSLKRDSLLNGLIRDELISIIKSDRTRSITRGELKRLITAAALHDNRNSDIMQALNIALARQDATLHENALAELLFVRIPSYMRSRFINDTKIVASMRQKLFTKLSKIQGPASLKIALFHLAPRSNSRKKDDFISTLRRLLAFIERTPVIDDESKTSIRSLIHNMTGEINRLESMYRTMFLAEKELLTLYSLYKPNDRLVSCDMMQIDRIIMEHCSVQTLYLYPCKDYLDLEKYRWSGDCSQGTLAVNHFSTPQFFNVRMFRDNKVYCGNIYMLQLEHKYRQYLLIDRIQTSEFSAKYVLFYQILKDAFQEMFRDFRYHEVLLPNTSVSNNKSLNQIFHNSKKEFPKVQISFNVTGAMKSHFEGLRDDTFRVLCEENSKN